MEKELDDTITKSKIWGLRIVAVVTVLGTVYSSFKPEDEARKYYSIVQPAVDQALNTSLEAEELAIANANDLSELRGMLLGMQSCNNTSSNDSKGVPKSSPSKSEPSPPPALKQPRQIKLKHTKPYLPRKPWSKQSLQREDVERLIEEKTK